jgi:uncharacterized membrane protein required for colicin V production
MNTLLLIAAYLFVFGVVGGVLGTLLGLLGWVIALFWGLWVPPLVSLAGKVLDALKQKGD